jgi:hypothetical protein
VHPNIPEPVDNKELGLWQRARYWLRRFIRERILLFVVALLVPDYILAWAIRQRLVAHSIVKKHGTLLLVLLRRTIIMQIYRETWFDNLAWILYYHGRPSPL